LGGIHPGKVQRREVEEFVFQEGRQAQLEIFEVFDNILFCRGRAYFGTFEVERGQFGKNWRS
jgi:hypothetical protein